MEIKHGMKLAPKDFVRVCIDGVSEVKLAAELTFGESKFAKYRLDSGKASGWFTKEEIEANFVEVKDEGKQ